MQRTHINTQVTTITDTKDLAQTEDTYFVSNDGQRITLMVADGAPQRVKTTGSLQPMLAQYGPETKPGRYAALVSRDVTAQYAATNMPLRDIALAANDRLRQELVTIYGDLTNEAVLAQEPTLTQLAQDPRYVRLILPICCITLARIDLVERKVTWMHGGDTAVFLLYKDGHTEQATPDQMGQHDDKMRALIKQALQENDIQSFEDLRPHLEQAQVVNIDNGKFHNYEDENGNVDHAVGVGVVNGMPQLADYLISGEAHLSDLEAVVLCSDGFFWPSQLGETPAEVSQRVNHMGHLIRERGLAGYLQAQRAEEASDPHGVKYQHFGRLDDATAVMVSRFDVSE